MTNLLSLLRAIDIGDLEAVFPRCGWLLRVARQWRLVHELELTLTDDGRRALL
jgi:hypothetical protein